MTVALRSSAPALERALAANRRVHYRDDEPMNENFSLVVMCICLLGSLAFLAEQLSAYH